MNWRTLTHEVSRVEPIPDHGRGSLIVAIHGHFEAIEDLQNRKALITRNFESAYPAELRALFSDLPLDIEHMVRLSRGLLAIQIERTPEVTGYPLNVAIVRPDGQITLRSYSQ
jgi:hypothetical protein